MRFSGGCTDISERCELVTDSDYWDKVVSSNPSGSYFHSSSWIDSVCQVYHLKSFKIVSATSNGPSGYLPIVEIKSRIFGHRLISTPFCEYGGIVILPSSADKPLETARSLHSFAESLRKTTGSQFIEYRTEETSKYAPENLNLEVSAGYKNFTLSGNSEEIWKKLDRKLRNIIRKSSQAGIKIERAESEDDVSKFYRLYLKVQTRRGSPVHREDFFQSLRRSKNAGFVISLAYLDSEIISAIVTTSQGGRNDWWMNVNAPEHRQKNATSFLLWNLIKDKSESSSNFSLDLGRTRSGSSIYEFKKQWAGRESTLLNLTDAKVSLSDPDAARFRFASKFWSLLPLVLARRIGPPVVLGIAL
jgi:FemAB-related protein (PEP-CTERM system-associated)